MEASKFTGRTARMDGARELLKRINATMEHIPYALVGLAARVFPAAVFWLSGQTKVEGVSIKDSTFFLFANEYRLPLIAPTLAAYLATFAEHFFPVLLAVGFASRLSALALLIMTLVIQIFVYPQAWPTHGLWAACFIVVIARGPGILSLDYLFRLDGRWR